MKKASLELLKDNVHNLCISLDWLQYSYKQCALIGIKDGYTKDEFDKFENLTSRYARTCDLLVNKVLRGIDAVEFNEPGTIIDAANRAEKRGLIESVDELRGLKVFTVKNREGKPRKALKRTRKKMDKENLPRDSAFSVVKKGD